MTHAAPGGPVQRSDLHPDALVRLSPILGEHLSDVFAKHREVESRTGTRNIIGRQNLVEALAHVGVLFQNAGHLDRDGQLAQVAFIEDHLRRVMMESFEEEVYALIGAAWDENSRESIRSKYDRHAAPEIRRGRLMGHVAPDQVQGRFEGIAESVVGARKHKVANHGWSAWKAASDDLEAAATKLRELQREMGAAIDAARSQRTARARWIAGVVLAFGLGALSNFVL